MVGLMNFLSSDSVPTLWSWLNCSMVCCYGVLGRRFRDITFGQDGGSGVLILVLSNSADYLAGVGACVDTRLVVKHNSDGDNLRMWMYIRSQ